MDLRLNQLEGINAFLRDYYTGEKLPLPNIKSTIYAFTVGPTIPQSISTNRFEIVFEETLLSTPALNPSANWILFPNPATNGEVFFTTGNLTSGKVNVEIYNILGQLVHAAIEDINPNSTLRTNINTLAPGMFVVKLSDEYGSVHTLKLIVK